MRISERGLIDGVRAGNPRAVSRLITLLESNPARAAGWFKQIFKYTGGAHIIGVTGAPGAGKSTLVDRLAVAWHTQGKRVAILAIDPSSPFSGGAILGDRIRMIHSAGAPEVFIRSMASRGSLGGLARATHAALQVLDVAGYEIILLETVGVGQAEIDVVQNVHTCLVLLVPGTGDSIQVIKAGVLEIADIFVINKADAGTVDGLYRDLRSLVGMEEYPQDSWRPEIVKTVATSGLGIEDLIQAAEQHRAWYHSNGHACPRKRMAIRETVLRLTLEELLEQIQAANGNKIESLVERCAKRQISPAMAAKALLRGLKV
jgi:LAO/AO transport system kinase